MNIIKVSEKQLDDIFVWRDKNKELVRNFLPYLDSGCIQTDNFSIEFKVIGEINDYIATLKLIIINDVIELYCDDAKEFVDEFNRIMTNNYKED